MTYSFSLEPQTPIPLEVDISDLDCSLLESGQHPDPFSVLGAHPFVSSQTKQLNWIVRIWRKDAREIFLRPVETQKYQWSYDWSDARGVALLEKRSWLFQGVFVVHPIGDIRNDVDLSILHQHYFLYTLNISYFGDEPDRFHITRDPYNFPCILPQRDLEMFSSGNYWHTETLMGSHQLSVDDVQGVRFAVWAPTAKIVSVVGEWNHWHGSAHPMRCRIPFGVWEIFIPHLKTNQCYGYSIVSQSGQRFTKIDPYAQQFENPPRIHSVISDCDDAFKPFSDCFVWEDQEWMKQRESLGLSKKIYQIPMSIYEVHLPSWMRGDANSYLGYREFAHRLISHLKKLHFTHVEFLPLTHHPYEGSWGYQTTGFYAPYSRLGSPDDLKYLINELHKHHIGVFLDLTVGHFARDSWAIAYYDGGPCYEYSDPREAEHKSWGTLAFNFNRNEVRSFLLGVIYYWLHRYHFDGIRVDAVSSILYKNFCRNQNEWIPNEFGGDANLQAISFLKKMNQMVHQTFPGVFMTAEESTAWPNVTKASHGLEFDAKWDLGWMNDTLSYLCTPFDERPSKHNKLTFRNLYVANERWILPLSHDEMVHGKGSLLDKCAFYGTPYLIKLSSLRTLLALQILLPGRPLLFMGAEYAQGREWRSQYSLDWHEAKESQRMLFTCFVSDILLLYSTQPALYQEDDTPNTFEWCDCNNANQCVIIFLRHNATRTHRILAACNFSPFTHSNFQIGLHEPLIWQVLLNSDEAKYGGSMNGPASGDIFHTEPRPRYDFPYSISLDLPSYATVILKALYT